MWSRINREKHLKYKYKMTIEDYNNLFTKQNGCCKICHTHQSKFKSALRIDHDHKTNKVRGLLCHSCNTGLGLFKDSLTLLDNAKTYLQSENDPA
jgi:hypothetical protein